MISLNGCFSKKSIPFFLNVRIISYLTTYIKTKHDFTSIMDTVQTVEYSYTQFWFKTAVFNINDLGSIKIP